jgi:hypothetical protein
VLSQCFYRFSLLLLLFRAHILLKAYYLGLGKEDNVWWLVTYLLENSSWKNSTLFQGADVKKDKCQSVEYSYTGNSRVAHRHHASSEELGDVIDFMLHRHHRRTLRLTTMRKEDRRLNSALGSSKLGVGLIRSTKGG